MFHGENTVHCVKGVIVCKRPVNWISQLCLGKNLGKLFYISFVLVLRNRIKMKQTSLDIKGLHELLKFWYWWNLFPTHHVNSAFSIYYFSLLWNYYVQQKAACFARKAAVYAKQKVEELFLWQLPGIAICYLVRWEKQSHALRSFNNSLWNCLLLIIRYKYLRVRWVFIYFVVL